MIVKTYECKECGKFDYELDNMNEELKECPKCNKPVKRVWVPVGYSWKCNGFAGRGFDIAK